MIATLRFDGDRAQKVESRMKSMLRDIHQLRDAPQFAMTAIEGLLTAEADLHEAVRYVPYCDAHRGVWSSHFARVILDAASQVDSIWKATTNLVDPTTQGSRLTITDHFARFGPSVACQGVVFFGGSSPCTISPFAAWRGGSFSSPAWWEAYNRLKHDRFGNQTEATLEHAVNAVAALILAIIYSGKCDLALMAAELLDPSASNPWAFTATGLLRDVEAICLAKIETKLFAHPLGVFAADHEHLPGWWQSSSVRFNIWWAMNAHQLQRPVTS
jgi:hypothetical protein